MKSLILVAMLASNGVAFASSYYIVTPMTGKRSTLAEAIQVELAARPLSAGVVGQPYTAVNFNELLVVTGDPAYTGYGVSWSISEGALPAGLVLDTRTGILSGTPTTSESTTFTVRATYMTRAGAQTYQLLVGRIEVSLSPISSLPSPVVSVPYQYDLNNLLTVSNDPSYSGSGASWSLVKSALQPGLSLTPSGVISGTATAGIYSNITIQATYKGARVERRYAFNTETVSLMWMDYLVSGILPSGTVGQPYGLDMKLYLYAAGRDLLNDPSNYPGRIAFEPTAPLPSGLSLDSSGVVLGAPGASGVGHVVIAATHRGVTSAPDPTFYLPIGARAPGVPLGNGVVTAGAYYDRSAAKLVELQTTVGNLPGQYQWVAYGTGPSVEDMPDVNSMDDGYVNVSTAQKYPGNESLAYTPAMQACSELRVGGYTDWYLPSIREMVQVLQNRGAINATTAGLGGQAFTGRYLTSTEATADAVSVAATPVTKGIGLVTRDGKNSFSVVRCVRRT